MRIEGNPPVPYFPFKVRRREKKWETINPVEANEYELNAAAVRILQLCDGYNTVDEVVSSLNIEFRTDITQIRTIVNDLLENLTAKSMVWFRKERMQWFSPPPPKFVLWDITSKCNLRCLHCVSSAGKKSEGELSTEECKRLLDELSRLGVQTIIFSGGEPLLRDDFFEIAEYASKMGFLLQLVTNGTLINYEVAQKIKILNLYAQVSLDGSSPEINDRFRGKRGSYKKTIKGIQILLEVGVPIMIETAVTKLNINDIPHILNLAIALGVNSFRILPFVPGGRGKNHQDLELAPDEMKKVTAYLRGKREEGRIEIVPMEFEWTFSESTVEIADPSARIGCDAATSFCTITPTGEVLPCDFFRGVEADNIRIHEFSWIWYYSRFLNYFRSLNISDIQGVCRECKWLSLCRGSCIAPNYVHGALFQSNCHCWIACDEL
ncbi:MAG: radical SAM protein [candidate division Zixibacteria bacterium]|nr:radical SAM protein [candidate division Zixibacteria bacterium]